MENINRYPGLIPAFILALSLAGQVTVHADSNQEDGPWGPGDRVFEYQGDQEYEEYIDKRFVPEKTGEYMVVSFNIAMDEGQSYGGSILEFHQIEHTSQTQVSNGSVDSSFIIRKDSANNTIILRQVGDINCGTASNLGPP